MVMAMSHNLMRNSSDVELGYVDYRVNKLKMTCIT